MKIHFSFEEKKVLQIKVKLKLKKTETLLCVCPCVLLLENQIEVYAVIFEYKDLVCTNSLKVKHLRSRCETEAEQNQHSVLPFITSSTERQLHKTLQSFSTRLSQANTQHDMEICIPQCRTDRSQALTEIHHHRKQITSFVKGRQ